MPDEARRSGQTVLLGAFFTAYWLIALRLDTAASPGQQALIGLATWAFLLAALRCSPPTERVQVGSMVAVATGFECMGSLVLGAYTYRLGNLPLFVPPGHGLFFLVALRLADLPAARRYGRTIVAAVFVGSVMLIARGLFWLPNPDVFGVTAWIVLVGFLLKGKYPIFYAVSFMLTMALEFYGTSLGNWTWASVAPVVALPAANPPAAIGAGYCIMDSFARQVAGRVGNVVLEGRIAEMASAVSHPRIAHLAFHIPIPSRQPATRSPNPQSIFRTL